MERPERCAVGSVIMSFFPARGGQWPRQVVQELVPHGSHVGVADPQGDNPGQPAGDTETRDTRTQNAIIDALLILL